MDPQIVNEINELAYYKWQEAGCTGDSLHHWLEAKKEVLTRYYGHDDEDETLGNSPDEK